jgi:hypothetical protein
MGNSCLGTAVGGANHRQRTHVPTAALRSSMMAWSPVGILATAAENGKTALWNDTGQRIAVMYTAGYVHAVHESRWTANKRPDSKTAALCSADTGQRIHMPSWATLTRSSQRCGVLMAAPWRQPRRIVSSRVVERRHWPVHPQARALTTPRRGVDSLTANLGTTSSDKTMLVSRHRPAHTRDQGRRGGERSGVEPRFIAP